MSEKITLTEFILADGSSTLFGPDGEVIRENPPNTFFIYHPIAWALKNYDLTQEEFTELMR